MCSSSESREGGLPIKPQIWDGKVNCFFLFFQREKEGGEFFLFSTTYEQKKKNGKNGKKIKTTHGQVVQKQLEPVVVPHRLRQALHRRSVQHLRADPLVLPRHGLEERQLELRVDEAVAPDDFAQAEPALPGRRLLLVVVLLALRATEGQSIVIIGLLRVVVRADLVDPEAEGLAALVLSKKKKKSFLKLRRRG